MSNYHIRRDQATVVLVGPFVADGDGTSTLTSLTITQAQVKLSKNGSVLSAKAETSASTHDDDGFYAVSLAPEDVDTAGDLVISVNVPGAVPVWQVCTVLTPAAYDSRFVDAEAPATAAAVASLTSDVGDLPTVPELEARTLPNTQYATFAAQNALATAVDGVPTTAEFEARTLAAADYSTLAAEDVPTSDPSGWTQAQLNRIADSVLRRHYGQARSSADGDTLEYRSLLGAIAFDVNDWGVVGTNLVIRHEDDSTIFATKAISTDANALPITGLDTA